MSNENVLQLTDGNFDQEVSSSELPVLVDFWAPWCGPCKVIGPVIDEIASELAGSAKVGKVNVDEAGALAGRFEVTAIPTLIIFKGGAPVKRITGLTSKANLVAELTKAG